MTTNIFYDVEEAGAAEYHEAGRFWYPQLEIVHLLAALKRKSWDDQPRARMRRHLLLYGDRGIWKTSIAKAMIGYMGSRDFVDTTPGSDEAQRNPVALDVGGQGITWERMRGSATPKGDILLPYLPSVNYLFSGELLSFLGVRRDAQQERVNVLNEMMEEGRVTTALVKMGAKSQNKLQETIENLHRIGVRYNPDSGMMSYDVGLSFVACSHIFNDEQRKQFEESGFLSRFHFSHFNPGDDVFKGMWRKRPGPLSPLADGIRAFNEKAWRTVFERVPYPKNAHMDRVQSAYDRVYTRIEEEMKVPAVQLRSMRDIVDMAQLLTAKATARCLSENLDTFTIPELTYKDADVDWVCRFVDQHMKAKYDEWMARAQTDSNEAQDRVMLLTFLSTLEEPGMFDSKDFKEWAIKTQKLSRSTAFRKLSDMKTRGWLHSTRPGVYIVAQEVIDSVRRDRGEVDDHGV